MNTIYFDSAVSDNARRKKIYDGQIFVFSPRPASIALSDFARELTEEAFGSLDPREAQNTLSPEEFVAIIAPLKPRFIHHPKTKELLRKLIEDMGCDLETTFFDVPRMRVSCHGTYLNSGVAYALHPHRDTWYSAPLSQLNWWIPLYDFHSESAVAFQPKYWSQPVKNGSATYNHYEWNKNGRKNAAQHIKKDTRKQPHPEEHVELDPQIRVVCPKGGILLFSGAQLHWTVPNTSGLTRFSIDFRTTNINDLRAMKGAPNVDSYPQGTTLREHLRLSDLGAMPQHIIDMYENTIPPEGEDLVFKPISVSMM